MIKHGKEILQMKVIMKVILGVVTIFCWAASGAFIALGQQGMVILCVLGAVGMTVVSSRIKDDPDEEDPEEDDLEEARSETDNKIVFLPAA